MRILSILQHSPPGTVIGGAERQMHCLHKGLRSLGVDVHVLADIANVDTAYQEFEGVPIWGVKFPVLTSNPLRPGNVKLIKRMWDIYQLVKKRMGEFDIIQANMFRQPAVIGALLARGLGIPLIVTIRCSGSYGDFKFTNGNWLLRRCLPHCIEQTSAVVALEDVTKSEALEHGCPKHKTFIIANSVIFDNLPNINHVTDLRASGQLLFIGRVTHQKRLETLTASFSALVSKGWSKRLVIVGGGDLDWLRQELVKLGIDKMVDLVGFDPNPESHLGKASCFINPSESEGMPNAVLEACAYGVPVILSDIPAHRSVAKSVGMEDFLFPVGNHEALSTKVIDLFNLSEERYKMLRRQCAKRGQAFSKEDRDHAYISLYERVIRKNNNELDG